MKKGVTLAVLTAVISGFSIFSNAIFVSKTDPLIFAVIRNAVVAVLLSAVLIGLGQWRKLQSLSRREWGMLVAIGAIGGGIPFALFFTGLAQVGALNGNIIQKSLFLWVALLAVPFLHERLSKVQLVGYVTLFLGMFVAGGTPAVVFTTGAWLILAATILWAVENVLAKVTLKTVPSVVVSWGRITFGLPFLLIAVGVAGKMDLLVMAASYAPMPIIVSSLFLTAYVTVWYSALAMAPATMVSSVLVFAPVVTAVATHMFLKKPVLQQQILNLALLSVGTVLVVIERLLPKKQETSL